MSKKSLKLAEGHFNERVTPVFWAGMLQKGI